MNRPVRREQRGTQEELQINQSDPWAVYREVKATGNTTVAVKDGSPKAFDLRKREPVIGRKFSRLQRSEYIVELREIYEWSQSLYFVYDHSLVSISDISMAQQLGEDLVPLVCENVSRALSPSSCGSG